MSLQTLDTKLLLLVNHGMANGFFDILMPFLSAQGYLLVLPFLLFLAIISSVRRTEKKRSYLSTALRTFVISCLSVLFVEWLEPALKNSIARIRPCRWVEGIRLIVTCPKSFSMPSGHAISSFAFAVPLFYLTRNYIHLGWRLVPLLLAGLIAFSRVYLGVHYPSDVLAGALLGAATGMALSLFYEWLWFRRKPV